MLTFKQKFLDDIRSGKKTQTLRIWKSLRLHAPQKDYIPGIGPIWVESVESVSFEDLTDADAIPDGFPTLAALKAEILNIYGANPEGNMYRIRFRLLKESEKSSEMKTSKSPVRTFSGKKEKKTGTMNSGTVNSGTVSSEKNVINPLFPGVTCKFIAVNQHGPLPYYEENSGNKETMEEIPAEEERKKNISENQNGPNSASESEPISVRVSESESESVSAPVSASVSEPVSVHESVSEPVSVSSSSASASVFLSEDEVAEKIIRRCRINRNVCDWNHEPGKSQDFYALFLQSPRNSEGIPLLDGYRLRYLMRGKVTEEQWEEICWIASEVCTAWTEWQYAVEHWKFGS